MQKTHRLVRYFICTKDTYSDDKNVTNNIENVGWNDGSVELNY